MGYQIGVANADDSNIPLLTGDIAKLFVSTGYNHITFLSEDGQVWTWGYSNYGQFGDNSSIANIDEKVFTLQYETTDFEVVDLCNFTSDKETINWCYPWNCN